MGLVFLDDTAYRSIPLATPPLLGDIPPSADLSPSMPEPGDQGNQGSCVGWAVAYALKSYHERVERQWSLDTDDHRFSPAFIYNQIKGSPDCKGGTLFVDALNLVRREGVAPLNRFRYRDSECSLIPDAATKQQAKTFAIADWRRVNPMDDVEIKTHIASGFPVLVGITVDQAFVDLSGFEPYTQFTGPNLGGHAMVIVGYDDARSAFKLINSWGGDWGEGGFGWVTYKALRQVVREAYVAQDIVVSTPPAPTPPTPGPAPNIRTKPPSLTHKVTISNAKYMHGLTVPSNALGVAPGMSINVIGQVDNAAGKTLQIVVRFNYSNGPPLFANQQESQYRDVGGLVATSTLPRVIGSNSEILGDEVITIPYYALNFLPTNGMRVYNLTFTAFVYLDKQLAAHAHAVPFSVRW